ncbi:Aquaporin-10 [Triplophysa tibetana]|uniref:Aquaporin-10 n=1 Tax=Triplophysa tibetana TaxID=1572043 RepID=A0A5A9N255_9TELE|nr:Aquaporin-10 [Triplophysa tibetana]
MSHVKKAIKRMKVENELGRQILGELLGTFVLLLFGCAAAAQVKTSRETRGQFLSVNMAFSVGVMSAMYLCRAVSDAIMEFSGGVLTVFGPNETASIFATYPTDVVSVQTNFLDQVVGTAMLMLCILPLNDKRNAPAPEALLPPIVATVVLGISMSMSANCGAAINPARDLGPRLFSLTAGWGIEVFTCYNYFFWIPIVAPMIGGVVGSILYLVFIQWHLPEVDDATESESKEVKDQTKVVEHNDLQQSSKKEESYLKLTSI